MDQFKSFSPLKKKKNNQVIGPDKKLSLLKSLLIGCSIKQIVSNWLKEAPSSGVSFLVTRLTNSLVDASSVHGSSLSVKSDERLTTRTRRCPQEKASR